MPTPPSWRSTPRFTGSDSGLIDLGQAVPGEQMTKEQVRALVLALHDIASVLATADPKLKAEVYAELGVSVSYDHTRRVVHIKHQAR